MCFSAEASLATGAALIPAGVYCLSAARRKDRAYLALAAVPLLFGVQQICEAAVWVGLGRGDEALGKHASLGFLFFAVAFWPAWVPLSAAALERRPAKRRLFGALAVLGLALGALCYVPAAVNFGEWVEVRVVTRPSHSSEDGMDLNLANEQAALQRLTAAQLRERYAEAFGEPARTNNRTWLIRRVLWRLQAPDPYNPQPEYTDGPAPVRRALPRLRRRLVRPGHRDPNEPAGAGPGRPAGRRIFRGRRAAARHGHPAADARVLRGPGGGGRGRRAGLGRRRGREGLASDPVAVRDSA
jgi:hypothetical protein